MSTTYFVRLKKNHEIVGIFCCRFDHLPDFVDECAETEDCEYAEVSVGGGIYWGDGGTFKVPMPEEETAPEETESDDITFDGASLTESWRVTIYGHEPKRGLVWRPVPDSTYAKGTKRP